MTDILFIANDPRILALIEKLHLAGGRKIAVESDYSSGISRIFDEQPAVVFLQNTINGVSCERPANQVKMLLGKEQIRLVLLSDDALDLHNLDLAFDSSIDISLPVEELNLQFQRLMPLLQQSVSNEAVEPAPRAFLEAESIELSLPLDMDPFPPFPEVTDEFAPPAPEAIKNSHLESPRLMESPTDEVMEFQEFFHADRHRELIPEFLENPPPADQPAKAVILETQVAPAPAKTAGEILRIERENPRQLFGSISRSPDDSFFNPPGPSITLPDFSLPSPEPAFEPPKPAPHVPGNANKHLEPVESVPFSGNVPLPATVGLRHASTLPQARKPFGTPPSQKASGPVTETEKDEFPIFEDLSDTVALEMGIQSGATRSYQSLLICVLLILLIASGALGLHKYYGPTKSIEISKRADKLAPSPASLPAAAHWLSQLIPRVAPDANYAATHPGWESYRSDTLEYLVFREKGRVRAVQVISEGYGAITLPYLKTCVRIATGRELPAAKTVESRKDIQVSSSSLQNGGEVVVYRKMPEGDIRGFVLSFPTGG